MPAIALSVAGTTGHGPFPPTTVSGNSPKVTVQGKSPLTVANHSHAGHTRVVEPYDFHVDTFLSGSQKVSIEGSPALRIGDVGSQGDVLSSGSDKVTIA